MGLHVLAGPGCDEVGKDAYADAHMGPDDVKISVGSIFKALTGSSGIPSENPPALRLSLALRAAAIRLAREKELSGWVLTSNGSRAHLDRLAAEAGADRVHVLRLTEKEACVRVGRIVTGAERRAACEEGIRGRWFARYQPKASDREVDP